MKLIKLKRTPSAILPSAIGSAFCLSNLVMAIALPGYPKALTPFWAVTSFLWSLVTLRLTVKPHIQIIDSTLFVFNKYYGKKYISTNNIDHIELPVPITEAIVSYKRFNDSRKLNIVLKDKQELKINLIASDAKQINIIKTFFDAQNIRVIQTNLKLAQP